ncbi:hypothetical protein EJ02DRAFT_499185 [Clathrospora elynae]|uniref:Uncharacterized protein n=1 Tax=Clathrospora elynae TaxID=706981 RepID=A0A6A5T5C8_9PLEO|nr:hypothetical protein EJ02DRAFT_499185 [Clathrospora elynae]
MKEAVRYLKALLTEPEHFESLLELTNPSLIYHLYTPSPSFNANALGLLAPEQELCFIAQHIHSPTARNLDRVFSTGGNYPTRLHTLPTPKE